VPKFIITPFEGTKSQRKTQAKSCVALFD